MKLLQFWWTTTNPFGPQSDGEVKRLNWSISLVVKGSFLETSSKATEIGMESWQLHYLHTYNTGMNSIIVLFFYISGYELDKKLNFL